MIGALASPGASSFDERVAAGAHRVRALDPACAEEIDLVAARMRETLVEVLGEERGTGLYTMDWLRARVRWHLDPAQCTAQIWLAEDEDGAVIGHSIVRVELDEQDRVHGLFSTTFVAPERRREGVADALLARGEQWMRERGMTRAATHTSKTNHKLIDLYRKRGYEIDLTTDEMVRLAMTLSP